VAIAAVAVVIAGSLAFWLAGGGDSGPQTTTIRNGEVWLQGQITQDTCDSAANPLPIGDVGCSITVNDYDVSVVPGNVRLTATPGTVTGLSDSADQSGSHADVYAKLTGPHSASILSAPKYYARISG
jgi:type 1 fimbria pilin